MTICHNLEIKPCLPKNFTMADTEKMAKDIAKAAKQFDPHMRYTENERLTDKLGDPVKEPNHYTKGEVECIDALKASMSNEAFRGFCKGNVIKYIWRYETKGAGLQDLKKAQVYLSWLIDETDALAELNEWLNEVRGGQ